MTIESLIAAIISMTFNMPVDYARAHVEAATMAAAEFHLPVELLLGMAYIESRFDPTALSRVECQGHDCKRVTGTWAGETAPPNARPTWYCGPMQTGGNVTWAECQRMRTDVTYGYHVGAKELTAWLNYPTCHAQHGDAQLRCALAGYGGGTSGVAQAATMKYPANVLWASQRVKQFADYAAKKAVKPGS